MISAWMIGPVGYDIYVYIDAYPKEDDGCYINTYKKAVTADAAIISLLLNSKYHIRLLADGLGHDADANLVRLKINSEKRQLTEINPKNPDSSFGFVISTKNGSRTWISNIRFPKAHDLNTLIATLITKEKPDVLYLDCWKSDLYGYKFLQNLDNLHAQLNYVNIGDSNDFSIPTMSILNNLDKVVLQISVKDSRSLKTTFQSLKLKENQYILFTRGGDSLITYAGNTIKEFPVRSLTGIDSTGAGAIFTSSVLNFLAKDMYHWPDLIDSAVMDAISHTYNRLQQHSREYYL